MRRNLWTPEEDALVRANRPVPGRSMMACYKRAHMLGTGYRPKSGTSGVRLDPDTVRKVAERYREFRNARAVGREFGICCETVRAIGRRFGIKSAPTTRDRIGDYIEYGGKKYCRVHGNVFRCSGRNRTTLARVLWEEYHGTPAPKGTEVIHKNGDPLDFSKDNLELVGKGGGTRRMCERDELAKARARATGLLANLSRRIKNMKRKETKA
jgi:hypothetical protein